MKFWELNNAIKSEMRLDPGLVLESERVRFINDAMKDITKLQLIELTVTQENVSAQYPTLPTGFEKLRALYWDGSKLEPLQADKDSTSLGGPIGYIMEAGAVRLYPKPMGAGTLRWTYTGTPMACTEADVEETALTSPALPESWHSLLVDYSCYRSHRKNGNILMAREYRKDFDSGLASSIRAYVSSLNSQIVESGSPEVTGGDY